MLTELSRNHYYPDYRHRAMALLALNDGQRATTHHYIEPEVLDRWVLKQQFVLLHIPTYSLELNLIETLQKQTKYHWRTFKSQARDALHGEVQRLLDGFGTFQVSYA